MSNKLHISWIALLVILLLGTSAQAKRVGGPGADDEMRQLQEKAASLALIHHLDLSDSQKADIKKILTPLQDDLTAARKDAEDFQDKVIKARLRQVIKDLESEREPSEPSESQIEQFQKHHTQHLELQVSTDQAMERIVALLTDEQKAKLRTFDPRDLVGLEPSFSFRGMRDMDPVAMIDQIRNASDEEFNLMVLKLERRLKRMVNKKNVRKSNMHELRKQRVQSLIYYMKNVRQMSDSDFNAQKVKLEQDLAELMPPRDGRGGRGYGRDDKGMGRGGKGYGRSGKGMGRGGQGRGRGPGAGANDDFGPGMGPGSGPGMGLGGGPGMGPGQGRKGRHGKGGVHKLHRLIFSQEFYQAL